jgi:glutathionyl-hydroquinone reductase
MHVQADVRLFQTLIRFDHVYVVRLRCFRNFDVDITVMHAGG